MQQGHAAETNIRGMQYGHATLMHSIDIQQRNGEATCRMDVQHAQGGTCGMNM
jgi:hypothetical protein